MVFSTPVFLFYFLVLTLLVYYLVPRKLRNVVILISSLIFYYWGEQTYVVIMFLSTAIDFTHGMLVEHFKGKGQITYAKMAVASSMFFNLLLLLFFKYWDFLASSLQAIGLNFMPVLGIHLPIGISFYTFQTMSYTIDVYRDDAKVQRSLVNFGTFVTLFPQLIAGPIIKYKDLGDQIDHRTHSPEQFASGVQVFVVGLAKKELLAKVRQVAEMVNVMAVRQKKQLGLGHAVLCAENAVGNEPFVVMVGDDLIINEVPGVQQLVDVARAENKPVIGVMEVPPHKVDKYGIIAGRECGDGVYEITDMIEKPAVGEAPSNLAIIGRYVLTPYIFRHLR